MYIVYNIQRTNTNVPLLLLYTPRLEGSPRGRRRRRHPLSLKKSRLLRECVKLALALNQLRRRVELGDRSAVQHHDPVAVHDGVDAVRDRDDRPVLENTAAQHLLQQRVGFDIHGRLKGGKEG